MRERVAVVGLGYVGLPLALRVAEVGFRVVGIDIDEHRVGLLRKGKSFTPDIPDYRVKEAGTVATEFVSSFDLVSQCDVILICVPTPLDQEENAPDLSLLRDALAEIAPRLAHGALVVVESTVAPGTTEGLVMSAFVNVGLRLDTDFFLGFSPERINPGSDNNAMKSVPKLVSGCSRDSLDKINAFYKSFTETVVAVRGTAEAEFAKLLENSYRLVNVSLVNELAFAAAKMGVDFGEVVRAASTKPYGFQAFYPGPGAGGHCIPVDPVYLLDKIRNETGAATPVLSSAVIANKQVPSRFVDEVVAPGRNLSDMDVLVCGLGYKRGVKDVRHSPASQVIRDLAVRGARVSVYDEHIDSIEIDGAVFESIDLQFSSNRYETALLLHPFPEDRIANIRRVSDELVSAVGSFGVV